MSLRRILVRLTCVLVGHRRRPNRYHLPTYCMRCGATWIGGRWA